MARMRAEDRKRQLLESAAGVFAERGYRGATTAELARAAGITEPILYRHFHNKEDLFVTLVEEVGAEVVRRWQEALDGVDDPDERRRILLAGNPATHTRGRRVYHVIFQAMTECEHEPEISRALRTHIRTLHGFLTTEVRTLQKSGAMRNDEPATALAWLLIDVAAGYGLVAPLRMPGHSIGSKRDVQRLLDELLIPQ